MSLQFGGSFNSAKWCRSGVSGGENFITQYNWRGLMATHAASANWQQIFLKNIEWARSRSISHPQYPSLYTFDDNHHLKSINIPLRHPLNERQCLWGCPIRNGVRMYRCEEHTKMNISQPLLQHKNSDVVYCLLEWYTKLTHGKALWGWVGIDVKFYETLRKGIFYK